MEEDTERKRMHEGNERRKMMNAVEGNQKLEKG